MKRVRVRIVLRAAVVAAVTAAAAVVVVAAATAAAVVAVAGLVAAAAVAVAATAAVVVAAAVVPVAVAVAAGNAAVATKRQTPQRRIFSAARSHLRAAFVFAGTARFGSAKAALLAEAEAKPFSAKVIVKCALRGCLRGEFPASIRCFFPARRGLRRRGGGRRFV